METDLSPCATTAGPGRRELWKLRDCVTSRWGLKAGVARPIPSVRPSIHLPTPPYPILGWPTDLGPLFGAARALRSHCPAITPAVFLQDFSCSSSLFIPSAARKQRGSIPASPSPTAQPCLAPFDELGVAVSVIAPAQSCSVPLIASGACFEPPLALLSISAAITAVWPQLSFTLCHNYQFSFALHPFPNNP